MIGPKFPIFRACNPAAHIRYRKRIYIHYIFVNLKFKNVYHNHNVENTEILAETLAHVFKKFSPIDTTAGMQCSLCSLNLVVKA